MTAIKAFVSVSALFAALVAAPSIANAQTRSSAQAPTTYAQHAKLASREAAASWKCTFKTVEIAPVSHDTAGLATAWVMVHRVKGEIIASERLTPKEVEQIRRLPCQGDALERPAPLVG